MIFGLAAWQSNLSILHIVLLSSSFLASFGHLALEIRSYRRPQLHSFNEMLRTGEKLYCFAAIACFVSLSSSLICDEGGGEENQYRDTTRSCHVIRIMLIAMMLHHYVHLKWYQTRFEVDYFYKCDATSIYTLVLFLLGFQCFGLAGSCCQTDCI